MRSHEHRSCKHYTGYYLFHTRPTNARCQSRQRYQKDPKTPKESGLLGEKSIWLYSGNEWIFTNMEVGNKLFTSELPPWNIKNKCTDLYLVRGYDNCIRGALEIGRKMFFILADIHKTHPTWKLEKTHELQDYPGGWLKTSIIPCSVEFSFAYPPKN